MSQRRFTHLHLHTAYSLLDGAIRIDELVDVVKAAGMDAVAITDHGNMFGIMDFYTKAIRAGIKPILGCEVYLAPKGRADRTERSTPHLILLARTQEGYQNLKYLVSAGYTEGFYYRPRIDKDLLRAHSAGLIALTACLGGEVARAFRSGGYERAKEAARSLAACMEPGMFFLEVQNNGYEGQAEYNEALRRIGQELDIPLAATNDCHYLTAEDARAHQVLMCIGQQKTLQEAAGKLHYTDELYVKTPDEMWEAMRDYPDAFENTARIADMCEEVTPARPLELPHFQLPEGTSADEYLRKRAHDMLTERFEEMARQGRQVDTTVYRKRLDYELDVICQMKFPGYFLIVQDFINWAKSQGIPVGPGRGSGAGSLVAYALRITNLDPIPLGLLFERFLNPERQSMPDFDVDFCTNRREEVIRYVTNKYGRDNVGQIATFHQLKSRSVVRDVGRALGMEYAAVDRIAKAIPEGPKVTLKKALAEEEKLQQMRDESPQVAELLGYAERLEHLNRHAGMHAAGVVIGNKPLWEYVPVFTAGERTPDTPLVSQFDMNFVEKCGLVKFDFLGLKTLTVIDTAVGLINRRPDVERPLDINEIALDDPAVYQLIAQGDTWGVFQLESSGFQELLKKLRPDCFEDIVAAVALYRPGPLEGGMVDTFIDCKHGRKEITYPHPLLEDVLRETYGVIVYQEQVMQAAQILAGFTLGAADVMRRAMGKKKVEEMAKQRALFVSGCESNGIPASKANEIFDLIDKFAGYGFNKSHSAAYALVTYQTAWLKTHYPVEFLAALLTCDRDNTDKVAEYIRLGRERGIAVLPPDVNQSAVEFSVQYQSNGSVTGAIRFGLGGVKGVGEAALRAIVECRDGEEGGPFSDIFDFAMRVDLGRVNKGVIESLVRAGAFDSTLPPDGSVNRGQVFGVIERAIEMGRAAQKDRNSGQTNLFDTLAADSGQGGGFARVEATYDGVAPWTEREILANEKAALGLFMSGHPMERYVKEAAVLTGITTADIGAMEHNATVSLAGIPMDFAERKTKSGKRIGLGGLEDLEGRVPLIVFSRALPEVGPVLSGTEPVLVTGRVLADDPQDPASRKISVEQAMRLVDVRATKTRAVCVVVDGDRFSADAVESFKEVLARHPGRCDAQVRIRLPEGDVSLALPEQFRLAPSDELLGDLRRFAGVEVEFR